MTATPRTYEILRRAVEEGIAYGYRRAFKHTEEPPEDTIRQEIETAIMAAIDEVFSFDEKPGPECRWTLTGGHEPWRADCGLAWSLEGGTPLEHGMAFCPGCGRRLAVELRRHFEPEAVRDVLAERAKQVEQWGNAHDDEHGHGELAAAAGLLVGGDDTLGAPEWAWNLIGKHRGDRRRQLVIGAALAIAEIERLDRAGGGE
jgi:hypothetical protein